MSNHPTSAPLSALDADNAEIDIDRLESINKPIKARETPQNKLARQKDEYLRLAADFDNFKKRTWRESERQAASQKEAFIDELLPILDNLERALAPKNSASFGALHQGVEMTLQQLHQLLYRHDIEPVEDLGLPFDPHRHEAISVRHDPHQPDQVILEVAQRGYCRGGKIFRPAKVIVNDLSHSPGVCPMGSGAGGHRSHPHSRGKGLLENPGGDSG